MPLLLLAILAYIAFDDKSWDGNGLGGRRRPGTAYPVYLLAVICFTASMLCKSSAAMFPAALVLYLWWRRGRIGRAEIWTIAPFAAVSVALGLVTIYFQQHRAIGGAPLGLGGPASRLAAAGLAAAFYFCKSLFPVEPRFLYPRWTVEPARFVQFLPWVVLGLIFFWLWLQPGRRGRHVLLGFGWFLLQLLPVLGFFPMAYQRYSWVADHFAYLSLLGLAGLGPAALAQMNRISRPAASLCSIAILCGFACQGRRHAGTFLDEKTLMAQTLRHNPDAWPAEVNLGGILFGEGRSEEAAGCYRAALRLNPQCDAAHLGLGIVLLRQGRLDEAESHLRAELRINPNDPGAHSALGNALLRKGLVAEAIRHFESAMRLDPLYAEAQNNFGNALFRQGRWVEAAEHFAAAVQLNPDFAEAHNNLGTVLEKLGRPAAQALAQYEDAVRLKPGYFDAEYNLGALLARTGRLAEATAHLREALRLNSNFAQARNDLGIALAQSGRMEEALDQFREAVRLDPASALARRNLGSALLQAGRPAEAAAELEAAAKMDSGGFERPR